MAPGLHDPTNRRNFTPGVHRGMPKWNGAFLWDNIPKTPKVILEVMNYTLNSYVDDFINFEGDDIFLYNMSLTAIAKCNKSNSLLFKIEHEIVDCGFSLVDEMRRRESLTNLKIKYWTFITYCDLFIDILNKNLPYQSRKNIEIMKYSVALTCKNYMDLSSSFKVKLVLLYTANRNNVF